MHVAVIGAGAFGGWTALHLLSRGARVTLIDAWGPGHSRSSSGGETRIIRAIYGSDTISARFALRSMQLWKEYQKHWNTTLLIPTGMMFLAGASDEFLLTSERVLKDLGVATQWSSAAEASLRYPQICFDGVDAVLYEPDAGVLMARDNCRTILRHYLAGGGVFQLGSVEPLELTGELRSMRLSDGSQVQADQYVFACGAWLGSLFPDLLASVIRPTRQDVLFVRAPSSDARFAAPGFPCWADRTSPDKFYGLPDIQHRGFKLASDLRGPTFDTNSSDRLIEERSWLRARDFLKLRFPSLADAPLNESRVCQYENTPDLGFLIDRHPAAENVWLVGGGSGHGYKHGPAVGEHVANLLYETFKPHPEFALERFAHVTRQPVSSI